MVWSTSIANAQFALPEPDSSPLQAVAAAMRSDERIDLISPAGVSTQLQEIYVPGAKFIKLHFSQFNPPDGAIIEVSNRNRSEIYRYSTNYRDPFTFDTEQGDDGENSFWAMSISGDTAIVRLIGDLRKYDPSIHMVEIDSQFSGMPQPDPFSTGQKSGKGPFEPSASVETACGSEERYDTVCWASAYPDEYERSTPVAMLITANGKECTAWRVGSSNHMFTARHCISTQAELTGTELWFNYEAKVCGGSSTSSPVKVSGGNLLATDQTLDFALFTVQNFSKISSFGNLGLDVRSGSNGEEIFIPQHGLGNPKQMTIESDMNNNGLCQIDDNNLNGYAPGSDIGYLCDTTTSSSGAPVIASSTGKVIALHHWGGCFNSGTKVSLIWSQVSSFFGGKVPKGNSKANWAPGNQVPVADFSVVCDNLDCSFDGSGSNDADGSIASFSWDLGEGTSASTTTVDHSFAAAGTYNVTLTVTDDEGATDNMAQSVTVSAPNARPVAKFSTRCIDNTCTFDASKSSDPDGSITAWNWSLGDGNSATGRSVDYVYQKEGRYTVTLTVEDDNATTDSASYTVTLTMPNKSPTASFNADCSGLDCALDGKASTDPDGSINSYTWDFGDGQSTGGPTVNHNYSKSGSYTITLTVKDNKGAGATMRKTVSLKASNLKPEANFTSDCDENRCVFDAGSSLDSDGSITSYDWDFGDGTRGSGSNITHDYNINGSFTVILKVTDNANASTKRMQIIKISTAGNKDEFNLRGSGSLQNGRALASLTWSGSESETVQVFRDGKFLAGTSNLGKYLDAELESFRKSARYQLCETASDLCSNEITVRFNP